uniref:Uncharacterized protein n=1 Tax=Cucumis melo TaxID=3656 RepID=A0A9I9DWF5_CUCME
MQLVNKATKRGKRFVSEATSKPGHQQNETVSMTEMRFQEDENMQNGCRFKEEKRRKLFKLQPFGGKNENGTEKEENDK